MKHKRNNPTCDPWDFEGNEKNAASSSIAFSLNFFIRNENSIYKELKTKKPFEIMLHVE